MRTRLHHRIFTQSRVLSLAYVSILAALILGCAKPAPPGSMQAKYRLSDAEAEAWERLYIREADSIATLVWGLIGRAEYDKAMLSVKRFADANLEGDFNQRINRLWGPLNEVDASPFTAEPQIGLGPGETVGFDTWGELLGSGFQRATLSEDSITVYFVLNGYWKTDSLPVYAAVACGDFGEEEVQWRPMAHLYFSVDRTDASNPVLAPTVDAFLEHLRRIPAPTDR